MPFGPEWILIGLLVVLVVVILGSGTISIMNDNKRYRERQAKKRAEYLKYFPEGPLTLAQVEEGAVRYGTDRYLAKDVKATKISVGTCFGEVSYGVELELHVTCEGEDITVDPVTVRVRPAEPEIC